MLYKYITTKQNNKSKVRDRHLWQSHPLSHNSTWRNFWWGPSSSSAQLPTPLPPLHSMSHSHHLSFPDTQTHSGPPTQSYKSIYCPCMLGLKESPKDPKSSLATSKMASSAEFSLDGGRRNTRMAGGYFQHPQEPVKLLSARKSNFPVSLPLRDEASDSLLKYTYGVCQSQR